MNDAQLRALEVLTKGSPVAVSNVTDYDGETVHWRPAIKLVHAGYARVLAARRPAWWRRWRPETIQITEDGVTAAKRAGIA